MKPDGNFVKLPNLLFKYFEQQLFKHKDLVLVLSLYYQIEYFIALQN